MEAGNWTGLFLFDHDVCVFPDSSLPYEDNTEPLGDPLPTRLAYFGI